MLGKYYLSLSCLNKPSISFSLPDCGQLGSLGMHWVLLTESARSPRKTQGKALTTLGGLSSASAFGQGCPEGFYSALFRRAASRGRAVFRTPAWTRLSRGGKAALRACPQLSPFLPTQFARSNSGNRKPHTFQAFDEGALMPDVLYHLLWTGLSHN